MPRLTLCNPGPLRSIALSQVLISPRYRQLAESVSPPEAIDNQSVDWRVPRTSLLPRRCSVSSRTANGRPLSITHSDLWCLVLNSLA
jgi:hypothetical protein